MSETYISLQNLYGSVKIADEEKGERSAINLILFF